MGMGRLWLPTFGVLILGTGLAHAQPNAPTLPRPRLQSIFPAGAKVGTTVEVTLTGTDIEDPEELLFSHPGIRAEPVPPPPPANAKPNEPPPMPMTRRRGMREIPLGVTKFKVTVGSDVPVGLHDVRLSNKWGVSNPRSFVVGLLPETTETEPNNDVPQAQSVALNSVVNGVISQPTDVDYYQVTASKGQRVLVHVAAASIDSLARPAIEIYTPEGQRVTFDRCYLQADALADVAWPHDGPCLVRVFQFPYNAGNADYFYRMTVTNGPWIDAAFPPMVEPGKTAAVTLYGRNLPGGTVDGTAVEKGRVLEKLVVNVTAPADPQLRWALRSSDHVSAAQGLMEGFDFRLATGSMVSNPFLFLYADAPVSLEQEPNDQPEKATKLTLPADVAGRIDRPLDRDCYIFSAKKGEVWVIDLFGERLGALADFYLTLRPLDPKANNIAEQDDPQELLHPFQFFHRTNDPAPLEFTAPADGDYLLTVSARDAATEFGPGQIYRLSVRPRRPNFRLVVMPAAPNRPEAGIVPAGGETAYHVFLERVDGFNGAVELTVEGLPTGVSCPPQQLAPNQQMTVLVLTANADAPPTDAILRIKGTSTINGQKVVREARPATITWSSAQPNQPVLSRMDRQLVLAVRDKPPFRLMADPPAVSIKQGDKATIQLKVQRLIPDFKAAVQVNAMPGRQPNQPLVPGVSFNGNNQPVTIPADKAETTATINVANNAPLGTYNYYLRGEAPYQFEKVKGQKINTTLQEPALPVTLTIIPASLGAVTASAGNLKIGTSGELTVRVNRQAGYAGEFKIRVVVPQNVKGVNVAEIAIPAGQNEVKVPIMIAADAQPGEVKDVVVQATGTYEGQTPIVSEVKVNLKIVK
jgi:hypothetical protein